MKKIYHGMKGERIVMQCASYERQKKKDKLFAIVFLVIVTVCAIAFIK